MFKPLIFNSLSIINIAYNINKNMGKLIQSHLLYRQYRLYFLQNQRDLSHGF